jgi:hypothetical protein
LVPLFKAPTQAPSKIERKARPWPYVATDQARSLNNQLIVNGSSMGDVRAEVCWGGSVWGDIVQ